MKELLQKMIVSLRKQVEEKVPEEGVKKVMKLADDIYYEETRPWG